MTQQPKQPLTPKGYVAINKMLHTMFLTAMIGFAVVVSVLTDSWQIVLDFSDIFMIIVPIVAVSGLMLSRVVFNKQLETVQSLTDLKSKMERYQTARLIMYALIEGPALFALVLFLNSENAFFLLIALGMILYFIILKPTSHGVETDLHLTPAMRQQFRNQNEAIL
ncbi:hypothetical protein M0G43_09165 [Subsaxibacter sp. CAU 1640]|uniref:hypothetical protein n=1 Tax=Subsaxibacter sp. CAU 1640 TaxID=2933271 RepID=UPI002005E958|nr:hypothetical protein [Subsaxibacter sp. CAU 1640]MCK7590742.1 hypothetical protein [Subsaxibacter sp. CAU 1640]